MRTKSIIVKCDGDGCKTYAEISEGANPPDWYYVRSSDTNGSTANAHQFELCSLRCLAKWATARRKIIPAQGNYPCGECDFVSPSIQGLRAHERNAHGLRVPKEA